MKKIQTLKELSELERFESWKGNWGDPDRIDVRTYIGFMCDPEDSLIFCTLLFPDLCEIGGAIILNSQYDEDNFSVWMTELDGNVQHLEKIINKVNLYDVFSHCQRNVSDKIYSQLAEVIALSWRLMLKEKFKDKTFVVETSFTDQDYGPTVTFYQG